MPEIIAAQADPATGDYVLGIINGDYQLRAFITADAVRALTNQGTLIALEELVTINPQRLIDPAIRKMNEAGLTWKTVDKIFLTEADFAS